MDLKGIIFMNGEETILKFKLGEIVIPTSAKERGLAAGPNKVIGLQLNGYIVIQPIGSHRRLLVETKDYEIFEGEVIDADNGTNAFPPGWGIKSL